MEYWKRIRVRKGDLITPRSVGRYQSLVGIVFRVVAIFDNEQNVTLQATEYGEQLLYDIPSYVWYDLGQFEHYDLQTESGDLMNIFKPGDFIVLKKSCPNYQWLIGQVLRVQLVSDDETSAIVSRTKYGNSIKDQASGEWVSCIQFEHWKPNITKISREEYPYINKLYGFPTSSTPTVAEMSNNYKEMVNSPNHYANREIEVIDFITDTLKNNNSFDSIDAYFYGNVQKYIPRAGLKVSADQTMATAKLQDLKKAQAYLNRWVESVEKEVKNE